MTTVRLQKALADAGVASRRVAEGLITQGRVAIDGQIVQTLGTRVDPHRQSITVDGKPVHTEEKATYALHKPLGVVSTVSDPQGRPTVRDLLKAIPQRIYPIGRLDADTTGLLLLTNDGELAYSLTHPSREVPKVYRVEVAGRVSQSGLKALARGIDLEDGPTAPAKAHVLGRGEQTTLLELQIHEGRNRQVRRMCQAIGHPVRTLCRVQIGSLALGALRPGAFRRLSPEELALLRRDAGLTPSQ